MSSKVKSLYERGKFFIETGTAGMFKKWAGYTKSLIIPEVILCRIEHFISIDDKDSAVNLWMHACNVFEYSRLKFVIKSTIQLIVVVLFCYLFVKVVF